MTDEAQIAAAIWEAVSRFGAFEIVFNNAGATGAIETIETGSAWLWDTTHAVLLRSVALAIRHAVPHMKARGGGAVKTASVAALEAGAGPIVYSKESRPHAPRPSPASRSRMRLQLGR